MLKKRILVISSANIDFVQRMRRVPYSGETVVEPGIGYSYVPGGKGANSAIAFARLGADCVFACKLGKDSNGKRLAAMYAKEGIDTRYIQEDPEVPTGLASILVEENGKNRIIVYPGANMTMTPADVEEPFICCPEALYMQLEVPFDTVVEAVRRANNAGIPVFIDAGPASVDYDLTRLGRLEVFSPNPIEKTNISIFNTINLHTQSKKVNTLLLDAPFPSLYHLIIYHYNYTIFSIKKQ